MKIRFNEETHQYTIGSRILISVTQLMQKHGLATDYSAVDMEVLRKASEKGIIVHEEIEKYIFSGETGFSWECDAFADWFDPLRDSIDYITDEQIVSDGNIAGKYDLFFNYKDGRKVLYDIKTESVKHITKWQWQLSLYNYIGKLEADEIVVLWFNDGKLKLQELEFIDDAKIEELIQAELRGEYFQPSADIVPSETIEKLTALETMIAELEIAKKEAETKSQSLRDELLKAMEKNGVQTFETPLLKVTYKGQYIRSSVDSKKLKEEYEDIWEECQKSTIVKPSIQIKVKEQFNV